MPVGVCRPRRVRRPFAEVCEHAFQFAPAGRDGRPEDRRQASALAVGRQVENVAVARLQLLLHVLAHFAFRLPEQVLERQCPRDAAAPRRQGAASLRFEDAFDPHAHLSAPACEVQDVRHENRVRAGNARLAIREEGRALRVRLVELLLQLRLWVEPVAIGRTAVGQRDSRKD